MLPQTYGNFCLPRFRRVGLVSSHLSIFISEGPRPGSRFWTTWHEHIKDLRHSTPFPSGTLLVLIFRLKLESDCQALIFFYNSLLPDQSVWVRFGLRLAILTTVFCLPLPSPSSLFSVTMACPVSLFQNKGILL